jgi:hypothetical protein
MQIAARTFLVSGGGSGLSAAACAEAKWLVNWDDNKDDKGLGAIDSMPLLLRVRNLLHVLGKRLDEMKLPTEIMLRRCEVCSGSIAKRIGKRESNGMKNPGQRWRGLLGLPAVGPGFTIVEIAVHLKICSGQ